MKLATRIKILTGTLMLLLVLTNMIAGLDMNKAAKSLESISTEVAPLQEAVFEVALQQSEQDLWLERARAAASPASFDSVLVKQAEQNFTRLGAGVQGSLEEVRELFSQAQVTLGKGVEDPEGLVQIGADLDALAVAYAQYSKDASELMGMLLDNMALEAGQMMYDIIDEQARLSKVAKTLAEHIEAVDGAFIQSQFEAQKRAQIVLLVASLLAIVIGSAVSFFYQRAIARQLGADPMEIERIASEVAHGNYDSVLQGPQGSSPRGLYAAVAQMQGILKERTVHESELAAEMSRLAAALDMSSAPIMVTDLSHNIVYMNQSLKTVYGESQEVLSRAFPGFTAGGLLGSNINIFPEVYKLLQLHSGSYAGRHRLGALTFKLSINKVSDENGTPIGSIIEWAPRTEQVATENEIQNVVKSCVSGDLSTRVSLDGKSGFFATLGGSINELLDILDQIVTDTGRVLEGMARGDLKQQIDTPYQGVFGKLKMDANHSVRALTEVLRNLSAGAKQVSTGAEEIAKGNIDLSHRTEAQASSLEQTSSSMQEMTVVVRKNVESAQQANVLAGGARHSAEKGGAVVGRAVSAMAEINDASQKIRDIIVVIDEIAFQTNLLALNAAVEAARAGEQGRGFAVVATEVRNLAQRSAEAAREIKELIEDSVSKVDDGTRLVNESGDSLGEIVLAVQNVSTIIAEITSSNEQQSREILQVSRAISDMDEVTQQNAALVEQVAAAGEVLTRQTSEMGEAVSFFSLAEIAFRVPGEAATRSWANREAVAAELDGNGLDFADARSKHLLWKTRLRSFLDGKESLDPEQATSHKDCDLGRWLYSSGMKEFGHMDKMMKLESIHEQMHKAVKEAVVCKHGGDNHNAEENYYKVGDLSEQVIGLLRDLEVDIEQCESVD